MKIQVKALGRLTQAEYVRLQELTFGPDDGVMYDTLWNMREKYPKDAKAIMVRKDDNSIIAWALVYPHTYYTNRTDFMVYVEPKWRRKGLGKRLYTKARQLAGGYDKIVVHPHDLVSDGFFYSVHN